MPLRVSIIGSGNWGCAISKIIGDNLLWRGQQGRLFDNEVRMYVYEEQVEYQPKDDEPKVKRNLSEIINETNENVKYLAGTKLPKNVRAVPNLKEAVQGAHILVWVMPRQFVPRLVGQVKEVIDKDAISVSLIKGGLDIDSSGNVQLCSESIRTGTGTDVSVLMGANVANEVAKGDFCEATIGTRNMANGRLLRKIFHCKTFVVKVVEDVAGVELCGALKNIVALAAGFSDGLGMGSNTKAALIRIGLTEMVTFIKHFFPGTQPQTFFESCGMADLITTCYAGRNRKCAEAWCRAEGKKSWEEVEAELLNGQKLQGTLTMLEVWPVIQTHKLEDKLPLMTSIYHISFKGQPVMSLFDKLALADF